MAAFGTGPSVDNTFGNQNGHYIFIGINQISFFQYEILKTLNDFNFLDSSLPRVEGDEVIIFFSAIFSFGFALLYFIYKGMAFKLNIR
jgi:hypothetical protein